MQCSQWVVLAATLVVTCQSATRQSYDTIVVGLGAAGATAASTLARAGRRVLALDAMDRVGGRVRTVPFGDGVVELGAEWIHGTENSSVYETAIKNNVSIIMQDMTIKVYKSDGTEDFEHKDLVKKLMESSEVFDETQKIAAPLGDFITRKVKDYLKRKDPEVLKDQIFLAQLIDIIKFNLGTSKASNDLNDISTQTTYQTLWGPQTMSWHRNGYKTLFELLLNTHNNGPGWPTLDIKLNKEVTQIKWPKHSTGKVEVVCKYGDVYTADNVIVTVSLGVLKERHTSLFSPPLPKQKVSVIDKLTIGVVGKMIFSFPERWFPDVNTFLLLWSPEDRELFRDDPWLLQLRQVFKPMGSGNTLDVWSNGDVAKLIETLPDDVVTSKMMTVLRKFLGRNITVPEPTGIARFKWYSNPFTRGCYSNDNLELAGDPNARETLATPLMDAIGNPKVLFAGEATDSAHFSTVHGASDSGRREAMRLLSSKQ